MIPAFAGRREEGEPMNPTDELKAEHEGILLMLSILEKICSRAKSAESMPIEHLEGIMEFLKVFADQCHHGKEETILFPVLEAEGIPRQGGPIGVMLYDHDHGRSLLREMDESLKGIKARSSGAAASFANAANLYIEFLRQHIQKENNVLFPMAERVTPQSKQEEISQEFEKFEREKIGVGRHEAFHSLMDKLSKIYL